ncbi:ABC-2 type transport system ATP-binding protein [Paenibacillus turicensis]|uniref:ABC-2 type transport system ATP-binding protein n=1 Tax=Paenibacillus turicensis TaxID=160487 RepID=A0ABS4FPN3_9BACL|nr:ABC transporter ATP-binding protein [Paenibacillus turicensis]MBP1904536.1 ABC-2 type transport system ATP-binding protein [Paenibacillus turicensis]
MTYSLEIKNLTKTYPNSDYRLDHVSFAIPRGTIMGFVGENGAGKTTTMNAILNTIKKDSGTIKIFGREMDDKDKEIREQVGVVFDADNFPELLTPLQLSKVMAGTYTQWDQLFFLETAKRFNLNTRKKIKQFSRGMKIKLALTVALSHRPQLLILDEATSGLDPIVRDEILGVFLEFVEDENHSILMSSHITSDLEKIADYITFIHQGKVLLTENKDVLLYEYGIARCKAEQFQLIDRADMMAYKKRDYQIDVLVKDRKAFGQKYSGIIVDTGSIDEIMLLLIKGEH